MSTSPPKPLTTFATIVGAVLVELRFRVDLRQRDLAAIAGVSTMSWSRFERGERDLLVEQLVVVAKVLHMPLTFVLDVADDLARRLERKDVEIVWLRGNFTPALAASSRVLGVADLADDVKAVMAKEKYDQEFLARGFRRLLAQGATVEKVTVAEVLRESLPHAQRIGRKVRPKALKTKRR